MVHRLHRNASDELIKQRQTECIIVGVFPCQNILIFNSWCPCYTLALWRLHFTCCQFRGIMKPISDFLCTFSAFFNLQRVYFNHLYLYLRSYILWRRIRYFCLRRNVQTCSGRFGGSFDEGKAADASGSLLNSSIVEIKKKWSYCSRCGT
jgi:hypothetical protein